ncbi:hypothetical protein N7495_009153 [Penicillium taxi]|uniref:uncharacterized protein n=1 Tax=Penicillium taxi TaxID=168475 RepID=UPI002544EF9E|nr:uncharacterized protein N7495_009153 [Penicillium taxi]KAJ5884643.1 hypothetical protein N7495_009153 [Penicillium taxi]
MIFYGTLIAPQVGVLIAKNSFASAYNPNTRQDEVAPDRWSTVIWSIWELACRMSRIDSSSLRYVLQDAIINEETNSTLFTAVSAMNRLGTDTSGNPLVTTWTPEDDQFYAAIGTPNGVGVVYLLKDRSNALERTISKASTIWVAKEQVFYMWFELDDYCV